MRRVNATLALFALAIFAAVPASATHGDIHPTYRAERVYFHCADENVRVHNVAAAQTGAPIAWNTSAPSGAFAGEGDGCLTADPNLGSQNGKLCAEPLTPPPPECQHTGVVLDAEFEGTFKGNLRQLTAHLHDVSHRSDTPLGPVQNLAVSLWIDGVQVLNNFATTPTAVSENAGVTHAVEFSITDIGLGVEDGNGQIQRTYRLTIRSADANIWVYDASEVPAGITFNPQTLAAFRIKP